MENTIDIYTDSSHYLHDNVKKNIFGYSGIILTDDRDFTLSGTISRKTIRDYFKLNCKLTDINITQGELIAISKSLWQFRDDSFDLRVFSDSLNSLNYIKSVMEDGELKIAKKHKNKYSNIVKFIVKVIQRIESNGGSVELSWVKGHAGCIGNRLADRFAKRMFIPQIDENKMTKLTKNQLISLSKIKGKGSKKKRRKFHSNNISERTSQVIFNLGRDYFYKKETNEFNEYKDSLVFKTDIKIEETKIFNNYTEIIKTTLEKVNNNLFKIKNGNRIPATV
jgi:ribonuclease HI